MLGLTKYAVENRKVNATQILCDLYIDIVPTVLLNNIEQGAPPEETRFVLIWKYI